MAAKPAAKPVAKTSPATQAIRDYVRSNYGYLAAFLDQPEIGPILLKAAQGGYDTNRLLGLLAPTKWWKTTTASARVFDAEARLDPATHATKVANARAAIATQASKDGLNLDPNTLTNIATQSLRLGWTSEQIDGALGAQFHYNANQATASPVVDQIKQMADQYMVPLSDAAIQSWGQKIIAKSVDPMNLEAYMREQAKSLFPSLSTAIDSGVTVSHYVEPYRQLAAQTLEIPPDQVDFMNPKWSGALNQVDPKTGQRTSMSLNDWQTKLMSDPQYGYDKTQGAQQQAASLADRLMTQMGA